MSDVQDVHHRTEGRTDEQCFICGLGVGDVDMVQSWPEHRELKPDVILS